MFIRSLEDKEKSFISPLYCPNIIWVIPPHKMYTLSIFNYFI